MSSSNTIGQQEEGVKNDAPRRGREEQEPTTVVITVPIPLK